MTRALRCDIAGFLTAATLGIVLAAAAVILHGAPKIVVAYGLACYLGGACVARYLDPRDFREDPP